MNRAARRQGTTSDVLKRAQETDLRRQDQIANQIRSINRLQAEIHQLRGAVGTMNQTLLAMVKSVGGEVRIPKDLKIADDEVLISEDLGDVILARVGTMAEVEELQKGEENGELREAGGLGEQEAPSA